MLCIYGQMVRFYRRLCKIIFIYALPPNVLLSVVRRLKLFCVEYFATGYALQDLSRGCVRLKIIISILQLETKQSQIIYYHTSNMINNIKKFTKYCENNAGKSMKNQILFKNRYDNISQQKLTQNRIPERELSHNLNQTTVKCQSLKNSLTTHITGFNSCSGKRGIFFYGYFSIKFGLKCVTMGVLLIV